MEKHVEIRRRLLIHNKVGAKRQKTLGNEQRRRKID